MQWFRERTTPCSQLKTAPPSLALYYVTLNFEFSLEHTLPFTQIRIVIKVVELNDVICCCSSHIEVMKQQEL